MKPLICFGLIALAISSSGATAQTIVLFDFDAAPTYTPLPINVVSGGVTAHLAATGQGFSIQSSSSVPVVPAGFSGHFIYPSSVYAADLLVMFSQTVTAFSILYAPQELGCDDSARMRVTAFMNASYVGTNTRVAPNPGTWPAATLSCAFPQGFNNVVVHYDAPPPTCTDWGPIFLADNMSITLAPAGAYVLLRSGCAGSLPVTHLVPTADPRIGSLFRITVDNLPIDVAYVLTGLSHTTSAFGPLPLDGAMFGMPGCPGWVSLDIVDVVAGAGGAVVWQAMLPASVSLVGLHFYQQALVPDPGAPNAFHAVMSNAMAGTIGQ